MINIRLLLIQLLLSTTVFAQKEANVWYFGSGIGLNFNNNRVTPLSGSRMNQYEGCASVADPSTGQLLFYSDGKTVWNRLHRVLPNGTGLTGSYTATQSALFVPAPDDENAYYLFTIKAANDTTPAGLHYSLIDKRRDGGLGDVVAPAKNILLLREATEKLTAVPHPDGKQYWIISHESDSDRFVVFNLSARGIATPRFVPIGSVHPAGPVTASGAIGYLNASPDGTRLACAVYLVSPQVELYDFDPSTGTITNYRALGAYPGAYGICFSPDNSKLYFSSEAGLFQVDIRQPDVQSILSSRTLITYALPPYRVGQVVISDTLSALGALQTGPDGRLYTTTYLQEDPYRKDFGLLVINEPNKAGAGCSPSLLPIRFTGGQPGLGLPNLVQSVFNGIPPGEHPVAPVEACPDEPLITISPNPAHDRLRIAANPDCIALIACKGYNSLGQQLIDLPVEGRSMAAIDVSGWPAGLLLLEIVYYDRRKGSNHAKILKTIVLH